MSIEHDQLIDKPTMKLVVENVATGNVPGHKGVA
jgi:hypothetical protein